MELDLRKPMAAGVRGHEQSVLSSFMHDLHCLNKFYENFWIHLTLSLQHEISYNYVTSVWVSFGCCMETCLIYLYLHGQWPHYNMNIFVGNTVLRVYVWQGVYILSSDFVSLQFELAPGRLIFGSHWVYTRVVDFSVRVRHKIL